MKRWNECSIECTCDGYHEPPLSMEQDVADDSSEDEKEHVIKFILACKCIRYSVDEECLTEYLIEWMDGVHTWEPEDGLLPKYKDALNEFFKTGVYVRQEE